MRQYANLLRVSASRQYLCSFMLQMSDMSPGVTTAELANALAPRLPPFTCFCTSQYISMHFYFSLIRSREGFCLNCLDFVLFFCFYIYIYKTYIQLHKVDDGPGATVTLTRQSIFCEVFNCHRCAALGTSRRCRCSCANSHRTTQKSTSVLKEISFSNKWCLFSIGTVVYIERWQEDATRIQITTFS